MKQFYPGTTLRSKYIADYPVYRGCLNCNSQFVHSKSHPQAGEPAKSKYPYCMKCLRKNAQDPGFVTFIKKLFVLPTK